MKTTRLLKFHTVVALQSFIVLLLFRASVGAAISYDFETPNILTSSFTFEGGYSNFSQVSAGGVSGSPGAVAVTHGDNSDIALLNQRIAPLSVGQTLETTMSWHYDPALADPFNGQTVLTLGFGKADSFPDQLYGGARVILIEYSGATRIYGYFQADYKATSTFQFDAPASPGWYSTVFTATFAGGAFSAYQLSTDTYFLGSDGAAPRTLMTEASFDSSLSAPGLQGADLRAGFGSEGFSGISHLDSYTVAVVPEPSLAGLVALGGGMLLIHRRTRRSESKMA